MQIIKDQHIVQDTWKHIADDAEIEWGDITVSLQKWQSEREKLLKHEGRIGLRITSEQVVEDLQDDLCHFQLLELDFPAFTDGRGFSQAWLLRNRLHFQGEIRAVGHFMRDQLFYLQRVGVNSFKLSDDNSLQDATELLKDFSVVYQSSTN